MLAFEAFSTKNAEFEIKFNHPKSHTTTKKSDKKYTTNIIGSWKENLAKLKKYLFFDVISIN